MNLNAEVESIPELPEEQVNDTEEETGCFSGVSTKDKERAYCTTFTGRTLHLLDPQPEDINILDIATGLALTCRYGGQLPFHYSVAQHSGYVSHMCPAKEDFLLWGLMHDAAEAYMGDMRKPYKPLIQNFDKLEAGVLRVIADKFGLKWYDNSDQEGVPHAVKIIDTKILYNEARQLLPGADWCQVVKGDSLTHPIKDFGIRPVSPEQAKQTFLAMFSELYYRR